MLYTGRLAVSIIALILTIDSQVLQSLSYMHGINCIFRII